MNRMPWCTDEVIATILTCVCPFMSVVYDKKQHFFSFLSAPHLNFSASLFLFLFKKNVSNIWRMPRLFIGKGWPAINQGRKPKGFWENEKLCEKRKVSAKDERFHEKRKVSRENREVSLLIKWPANNLNTLNVWPAIRQRFGTISKKCRFPQKRRFP